MSDDRDAPAEAGTRGRKLFVRRKILKKFCGERGASLIEFAIIVIPFFALLFGTLEVGFIVWGTQELENATEEAARQIRTGQIHASGNNTEEGFRTLVCSRVSLLGQCETKLRLDVRSFGNFGDIAPNAPGALDADGNLTDDFTYDPGGPGSIMLVSTFYQWPLLNIITSISLSNMADGDRLLRATAAFRNENWPPG